MEIDVLLSDQDQFSLKLYKLMSKINSGISELELYEFRYALANLIPQKGWPSIELESPDMIEDKIGTRSFFSSIQFKPTQDNHIVLDEQIVQMTQMLLVGLVSGAYPITWVKKHFYFDIRSFVFLVHTHYFNQAIRDHFGGSPCLQLNPGQIALESQQDIGLREFRLANQALDSALIQVIKKLINLKGTPLILTLVGPTGAGKTEILEMITSNLTNSGINAVAVEMDNFYKDGEYRQGKILDQHVIHYELLLQCLKNLTHQRPAIIPRYNFLNTTSSHDNDSKLRPGQTPLTIEPADVIFLEGNYPFHQPEISPMIDIKIVYLTDDPVRLKRKWRRDIDYRKKYDPVFFVNRYFRTQFLRVEEVYHPLMAICDLVADTTAAAIWITPELRSKIDLVDISTI